VFRYETLSDERNFIFEGAMNCAPSRPFPLCTGTQLMGGGGVSSEASASLRRSVERLVSQDVKEGGVFSPSECAQTDVPLPSFDPPPSVGRRHTHSGSTSLPQAFWPPLPSIPALRGAAVVALAATAAAAAAHGGGMGGRVWVVFAAGALAGAALSSGTT
jgi:hypothetical protein